MTDSDLFKMAKTAFPPKPQAEEEEEPKPTLVQRAKNIGSRAGQAGLMLGGAVASLGKPVPTRELNPKY
jgi:hypothetical protein